MGWLFLYKQEVLDLHAQLITAFGGIHGLRDEGGLESAITAAEHRAHYESASLAICAATYAYHLCKAHAFLDGNKRIAAAATELFIELNNARLNANNDQIVDLFMQIAAGKLARIEVEQIFEDWVSFN